VNNSESSKGTSSSTLNVKQDLNGMGHVDAKTVNQTINNINIDPTLIQDLLKQFQGTKLSFSDSVDASIFNFSKDEFMQYAKKYISNQVYLSKIESQTTIKNMIKALYESNQKEDLASILYDLSNKIEFETVLEQWTKEHYNADNEQVVKKENHREQKRDCIYVVMRHIKASEYEIEIFPRYSRGSNGQKSFILKDIDSKESQFEFIAKFRGLRPYIPIHLIISEELYLHNIRLWKKRNRDLLDLANPLYLHTLERFDDDVDNYSWMQEDWRDIFLSDNLLCDSLAILGSDCCSYNGKDENNNGLLGVCYSYQPKSIDEIYDPLDLAYISLWSHCTETVYQQKVIDNFDKITIGELPHKVSRCQHLSLLWDDMSMLEDFKRELE